MYCSRLLTLNCLKTMFLFKNGSVSTCKKGGNLEVPTPTCLCVLLQSTTN
jgi:hypothetical protein